MFTLQQAKDFVSQALSIWEQGDTEKIDNLYTKDVVGHFNNKEFYHGDITQRMLSTNSYSPKRIYTLQNLVIINDLIIFTMRQVWFKHNEHGLHESFLTGIYRIDDDKICEVWIMSDLEMDNYAQASDNIDSSFDQFSVAKRKKSDFLQNMSDMINLQPKKNCKLSDIEIECLFYYFNGYTAKEVARVMDISHRTVEGYLQNIKHKYHCSTRHELRLALFPNSDNDDS